MRPFGPPRLLVVNGCELSQAVGSWSSVLAGLLDVPIVNLAVGGASNHRIIRTTVEVLDGVTAAHDLSPDVVLVVAMFTAIDRHEVRADRAEPGGPDHDVVAEPWLRLGPWAPDDLRQCAWRDELYQPDGEATRLALNALLLHRWLTAAGYPHAFSLAADALDGADVDLSTYFDQFDPRILVGGPDQWLRGALVGGAAHADHVSFASDVLYSWIIQSVLTSPTSSIDRTEPNTTAT